MRRFSVSMFLIIFSAWLSMLDRCLISTAGVSVTGKIVFLILLQASILVLIALSVNGVFPVIMEALMDDRRDRVKFLVFGTPLLFLLFSPMLIAETMYEIRYSITDKFVVNEHVKEDLMCCWNPL